MSNSTDNPPPSGKTLPQDMDALSLNASASVDDATSNEPRVPAVNLASDPPINFVETRSATAAPAAATYSDGDKVVVDNGQVQRIRALQDNLDYPVRTGNSWPRATTVMTNHFRLELDPKTIFYEYQIVNIPDSEKRAGKKRYMTTAIDNVPFMNNNRQNFATDYIKTIISWVDLHSLAPGPQVHAGDLSTGAGGEWRLIDITDRDSTSFLNIQYLRQVDIKGLQDFSTTKLANPSTFNPGPAENALNIILANCVSLTNTLHLNDHKFFVRDGFFDLRARGTAPLRGMRGYAYSVKPAMGNILLNVAPVTSAFWRPLLVSQVLSEGLGPFNGDEMALRGVRVYITYDRGSSTDGGSTAVNEQHARIKTIRGFGEACNVQTFRSATANASGQSQVTQPTIEQYQRQRYGRRLKFPHLKAINVGTVTQPTWMAPEDLRILPDQIYAKVIPDAIAKFFHEQSCRPPNETRSKLEQEGLVHFPVNASQQLVRCPLIRLHKKMLQIPTARLPYAQVQYKQPPRARIDERNGSWNLGGTKFLRGAAKPLRWKLFVAPGVDRDTVRRFIPAFNQGVQTTGVCNVGNHLGNPIELTSVDEGTMKTAIKGMLGKNGIHAPDIAVLLLQSRNVDVYSSFKYLADKVFVLHSICASAATFKKQGNPARLAQYMANISMKANLKRAGINHSALGIDSVLQNTLVLGADVTHPGAGAMQGTPSIAAVVGSIEANGGRFCGEMQLQTPKQEVITDLRKMVQHVLFEWCKKNNRWPTNVLYYRDGVSISQFDQVVAEELPEIEAAFRLVAEERHPKDKNKVPIGDIVVPNFKLTAIVVSKRHGTRFFPSKPEEAMASNMNCRPGTLVDSLITSPYYADFFLQSHNGIKGTARPCHYFILRNESKLSVPELQSLTHDLCHTYVRATLGVSYDSPAYYADRLCERGRAYLRDWYNPSQYWRNWYNNQKIQVQSAIEQRRAQINQSMPARGRNQKKTDAERQAEKDDAQALYDKMKAWIAPDIIKRWSHSQDNESGAGDRRKAGWSSTMYWM